MHAQLPTSCNVAVIIRDAEYFRVLITEKFFMMFQEDSVQILTQKSRIPCFRPDGPVMRPDTHQCREAEQFKVASVWTSRQHDRTLFRVREDSSLYSSESQSNTVVTPRSLIRKLLAYTLHPFGRQGNTVQMWSYYGNYVQKKCNCPDSRATLSKRGLTMEMRGAYYGNPAAQKTV
jgi:hypothetical protein